MYNLLMDTVSVSQARAALPEIIARVAAGEDVTLTRHGVAVAVVVRPDRLRTRRVEPLAADVATVRDAIAAGRGAALPRRATISPERADQLVAEVRAGRAQR